MPDTADVIIIGGGVIGLATAYCLAEAGLAHVWAGLRPALATGPTPLIGPIPGWRNAWLATGHGAWGITLSPGTGRLLAQTLLGRPTAQPLAPFALSRS